MDKKGRRSVWHPIGIKNPAARLSSLEILKIRKDDRIQKEIAADYGVSKSLISAIKLRKVWTNGIENANNTD